MKHKIEIIDNILIIDSDKLLDLSGLLIESFVSNYINITNFFGIIHNDIDIEFKKIKPFEDEIFTKISGFAPIFEKYKDIFTITYNSFSLEMMQDLKMAHGFDMEMELKSALRYVDFTININSEERCIFKIINI